MLTDAQRAIRLDDPANGPEFSVRIMNTAKNHSVETLGDLYDKLMSGDVAKYWKGIGSKSIREMKDFFQWLERPSKELFEDPEYVRHVLEDRLGTIHALLVDVQGTILRTALKGGISKETRTHIAFKLRDAARYAEQLPTFRGDN